MRYRPVVTEAMFKLALFLLLITIVSAQGQTRALQWSEREDLNILLPGSIRIYEANGLLADSAKVRAIYATVDLRDENLKLHAVGNNKLRETTVDAHKRNHAILTINGGYFSSTKSESLLVSDGDLIAAGPTKFTRGAFGLVNRKPQIVWPFANDSLKTIYYVKDPIELTKDQKQNSESITPWHPAQAIGGGPMLIKEGKLRDGSKEEGFGAGHLLRHPRTAIGYRDEHTLVMIAVDGRQQSSAGVTIVELAQIMLDLGCYEAVNLDGGGSSVLVAADEVVNIPVDAKGGNRNRLRKNASALVVTEELPSQPKDVIVIDTDSKAYSEKGTWENSDHVNYYGTTASRKTTTKNNKAAYRFNNIDEGTFQLAVWWTVNDQNTKNAKFILHRGKQTHSIVVDQTLITSNGRWNILGNFRLSKSDYLEVITDGDGSLVADAIRLVKIDATVDPKTK
jgi:hypothetical protein